MSTSEHVERHTYDPDTASASDPTPIISNMSNPGGGHVSRTLLLSQKQPDFLVVSRGSAENLDMVAVDETSGVSQIRAFNISTIANSDSQRAYNYPSDGLLLGWGLRNSVGVAEHPSTGGIWSVENSADSIRRMGRDIHEDNPGEELNSHGSLADASEGRTGSRNHGYPACFAVWNTTDFPSLGDLTVGDQFSLENNDTLNDATCADRTVSPRLTFQAHTAPLDIKFNATDGGSRAFISFHGSWNRVRPAGYKLSYVAFSPESGEPTEASDSVTAVRDVLTPPDTAACSKRGACLRPVGLAFDASGERLFVSSDATGEIWVVMRNGEEEEEGGDGDGEGQATPTSGPDGGSGSPTDADAPVGTTSSGAAAPGAGYRGVGGQGWAVVAVTMVMVAVGGLTFWG